MTPIAADCAGNPSPGTYGQWGIDAVSSTLREGSISPGRRILLDDQGSARRSLREAGVATLAHPVAALMTTKKLAATAERTGLSREYLTILRRRAQSWFPQPVALSRFPGVAKSLVGQLASAGIKRTSHLFTAAAAGTLPDQACEQADIDELLAMADLVRVPGVGPLKTCCSPSDCSRDRQRSVAHDVPYGPVSRH